MLEWPRHQLEQLTVRVFTQHATDQRVTSDIGVGGGHVSDERTGSRILGDMRNAGVGGAQSVEHNTRGVVVYVINDHVDSDVNGMCFRCAGSRVLYSYNHMVLGRAFSQVVPRPAQLPENG